MNKKIFLFFCYNFLDIGDKNSSIILLKYSLRIACIIHTYKSVLIKISSKERKMFYEYQVLLYIDY